jgi:site-specific DNA-methyltransferase (adenine-specific)/modification methylase
MIDIRNENCLDTMQRLLPKSVDVILTSPFYNTNKKAGQNRTLKNTSVSEGQYDYVRYDTHVDNMTDEEYCDFTVELFEGFDRVLARDGSVLYNICYGAENTAGMFMAINAVLTRTNFTIADVIVWKKSNALPNSTSRNRLTRIWEFVFVFCRKGEIKTFRCNKEVKSLRKTGQKAYENVFNYIEAKNNDETCPFNKATFSTDLCKKLLSLYAVGEAVTVYDPFMGSGTTAVACQELGFNCIGSEISENQVHWAEERLARHGKPRSKWLDELLGGD